MNFESDEKPMLPVSDLSKAHEEVDLYSEIYRSGLSGNRQGAGHKAQCSRLNASGKSNCMAELRRLINAGDSLTEMTELNEATDLAEVTH